MGTESGRKGVSVTKKKSTTKGMNEEIKGAFLGVLGKRYG